MAAAPQLQALPQAQPQLSQAQPHLSQTQPQAPAQPQMPGLLQQTQDPLAELRDIHQPAPIDAGLPAIGWWLLALLALLALTASLVQLCRHWWSNRYRREALKELDALLVAWQTAGDDHRYLAQVQTLLKRTALTRFPREQVAGMTGESWVTFLDHSTATHDYSLGDAEVLIDGLYKPKGTINVERIHQLAETWIKTHHPKHQADQPGEDSHERVGGSHERVGGSHERVRGSHD
ncbi:MAG: DUF4381 domain-containing protein [Pseudomonadales bacterium]